MTGKLIAFEGADESGTTTQVKAVADYFSGKLEKPVHTTFEPSSFPIGKVIKSWLRKELPRPSERVLATSFMVDRLHHWESQIKPILMDGRHVFTDRFSLSTFVYQSVKQPLKWLQKLDYFLGVPFPDLTLILDLPVDVAFERISKRGEEKEIYEEKEFQKIVANGYRTLPSELDMPYKIVDVSQSEREVTEDIISILQPILSYAGIA